LYDLYLSGKVESASQTVKPFDFVGAEQFWC
jgi:hypothetical protein